MAGRPVWKHGSARNELRDSYKRRPSWRTGEELAIGVFQKSGIFGSDKFFETNFSVSKVLLGLGLGHTRGHNILTYRGLMLIIMV